MYEFLWFLGGALVYQLLSKLAGIGYAAIYVKETQIHALKILYSTAESIEFIRPLKYLTMQEADMSEELVEESKKSDEEKLVQWKESSVTKIKNALPKGFERVVKFENWNEAMNVLKKSLKKR